MKEKTRIYELIVIGGGPAGVAAAVSAKTTLSSVLLVEKKVIGGKVNEIPLVSNHTDTSQVQGGELGSVMRKQLQANNLPVSQLEVSFIQKKKNLFIVGKGKQFFYSHSAIITTGSSWRKLELEKTKNTHYRSFSYRVASSAHLARERRVLVVGGGYSGCQAANFLSNFAEKVYLIHKGRRLSVNYKLENKVTANKKVEIYLNSTPLETSGKEGLESCTISTDKNLQKELKINMIFPCIGTVPNSKLARKIVDCTEEGKIKVDSNLQTSTSGLFAAGDVILKNNSSQISAAAIEGNLAAQAAIRYLRKKI